MKAFMTLSNDPPDLLVEALKAQILKITLQMERVKQRETLLTGLLQQLQFPLGHATEPLTPGVALQATRLLAADDVAKAVCEWAEGKIPHKELVRYLDRWREAAGC